MAVSTSLKSRKPTALLATCCAIASAHASAAGAAATSVRDSAMAHMTRARSCGLRAAMRSCTCRKRGSQNATWGGACAFP